MSADAFSHSKRTADLVALNVIIKQTGGKKKRLMLTCEGEKQAVRWRWNVRKIAHL